MQVAAVALTRECPQFVQVKAAARDWFRRFRTAVLFITRWLAVSQAGTRALLFRGAGVCPAGGRCWWWRPPGGRPPAGHEATPLLVTRPLSTPLGLRPLGTLRPLEQFLSLLIDAGFAAEDALHVYRAYYGLLYGHIFNELPELIVDPEENEALLRLGLNRWPPKEFPRLGALAPVLVDYDGAAELDQGISILLSGWQFNSPHPHTQLLPHQAPPAPETGRFLVLHQGAEGPGNGALKSAHGSGVTDDPAFLVFRMIRADGGESHEDMLARPADLGRQIGNQQRDLAQNLPLRRALRQDPDRTKPSQSPSRSPRDLQAFSGSGLILCDAGFEEFKDVGHEPIFTLRACSGWRRRSAAVLSQIRGFREPAVSPRRFGRRRVFQKRLGRELTI